MTVNESSEKSVNKASGDDLASEIRAVLTFIKSKGVRLVSDNISRDRRQCIAIQNIAIISNEESIRSNEAHNRHMMLMYRLSDQEMLVDNQKKRLAQQIQRMRSQSQRLSKLEGKFVEKIPLPYTKVYEKLPEEIEKITESNPKKASPPPAKAKSRRKGGRCQIS